MPEALGCTPGIEPVLCNKNDVIIITAISFSARNNLDFTPARSNNSLIIFVDMNADSKSKFVQALSDEFFQNAAYQKEEIDQIADANPDWVIERAFENGTTTDMGVIVDRYGEENVKRVLIRSQGLSRETVAIASSLLGVEREAFECHAKHLKENTPPWHGTERTWVVPEEERKQLSIALFWDVPKDEANLKKIVETNPYWFVERVFDHGNHQAKDLVIKWYGKELVIEILCWAESLRRDTVAFACSLFGLEKEAFRCVRYNRKNPFWY